MKANHMNWVLGGALVCSLVVQPLSADTIGYWRFEEGATDSTVTTAVSQVNTATMNATQASGNAAAVKYSGDVAGPQVFDPISGTTTANTLSMLSPTFVPPSGGSQSKLVAANSQGTPGQSDFTYETFIKIASPTNGPIVFGDFTSIAGLFGSTGDNRWTPRINNSAGNGRLSLYVRTPDAAAGSSTFNQAEALVTAVKLNDGQWHHVAFTVSYNATSDQTQLGVIVDYTNSATATIAGTFTLATDLDFGRLAGTDGEYDWHFDEIRLSGGVLTSNQFLQIVPEPGAMGVMGLGLFAMTRRRPGAVSR